jgi:drug/metabolite transporter (DMT)-like permease
MVLFASSLVAIRAALSSYHPLELASLRFIVASLVLLVMALGGRIRAPGRHDWPRFLLVGFLFFLNMVGSNYGLKTIEAGEAAFILNTVPLLTAVLAFLMLGEVMSGVFWVGLGLGLLGVSLIVVSSGGGLALKPGSLFLFLAALTFATFQVVQKDLLRRHRPLEVTSYAVWVAAALLAPFGISLPATVATASVAATGAAVYLGIFPSAIAFWCWFTALERIEVSRVAVFLNLGPVLTVLIAFVWLGELPSLVSLGGGALVLAGVAIANRPGAGTLTPRAGRRGTAAGPPKRRGS